MNNLKVSISFTTSQTAVARIEELAALTGLTRSRTIAACSTRGANRSPPRGYWSRKPRGKRLRGR